MTALDTQPVAFEVHVLLRTSLTVRVLYVSNVGMHARTAVKDNVPSPPLGSSRPVFHFPIDWLNLVGFTLLVETFWTFPFVLDWTYKGISRFYQLFYYFANKSDIK